MHVRVGTTAGIRTRGLSPMGPARSHLGYGGSSLLLLLLVVSLASHPAQLPLCGTELGIRKSRPPLTSRETSTTPTNQLY